MKRTLKLVLQGLVAVLPLVLTAYCIIWFITFLEDSTQQLLLFILPDGADIPPGMGIIAGLFLLFFVGLMVNTYGMQYLMRLGSQIMESIPLVKSVYGAIQDIISVFNLSGKKDMKSVVSVDVNGMQLIGFITGEEAGKDLFKDEGRVGVYLPMSYQIGGFTVYIEKERLTYLDISVEQAMRIAITGGVQSHKEEEEDLINPLTQFIQGHTHKKDETGESSKKETSNKP
ncbi:DUF502 domain-containing protein [Neptunomonas phycophila]|mgnify:CR=1 FL=1|jgi:uncharacterized membrane protein|uniref:DUF502 domain-containing protein n=1 Tax=Neptunomonas phycophila TaxID=1572645 RepID=A0AAW7XEZ7_9GAMM|nr:DUF502 domain-containing protein [Neptunomonas phycophila]MDO6452863.1 DUF502 domain-containing protein [Neptunomonas phycophila]MDO6783479.1 DUF502 domain-containing protein [Neptunomonas phycophila]